MHIQASKIPPPCRSPADVAVPHSSRSRADAVSTTPTHTVTFTPEQGQQERTNGVMAKMLFSFVRGDPVDPPEDRDDI